MNKYKYKVKPVPFFTIIISLIILTGCSATRRSRRTTTTNIATTTNSADIKSKVVIKNKVAPRVINTKNVSREELVDFAESLIGVKYKYGSMIKENGFDCSGFINYVFNHFKISVPRITVDFTNAGKEIPVKYSKPGDLILFTGSDAQSGIVGHMGIVTENNNGDLKFIHASTSRGVMISGMNSYFLPRFVKVNRVFPDF
jgi:cell wall-associated NlpC family hydrolase